MNYWRHFSCHMPRHSLTARETTLVLTPDLYAVAREKDTERPFTGKYWKSSTKGTYYGAVCGNLLFRSDVKFACSFGGLSFYEPSRKTAVLYHTDDSYGMHRTEVLCGRCGSHLGHIFDEGPAPTYKRFCINSVSLDFQPDMKKRFLILLNDGFVILKKEEITARILSIILIRECLLTGTNLKSL